MDAATAWCLAMALVIAALAVCPYVAATVVAGLWAYRRLRTAAQTRRPPKETR